MLFKDMVFESQAVEFAFELVELSDKRCSHCHRMIVGRVYQSGAKYYDSYCWQFRFINANDGDGKEHDPELRSYLDSLGDR